MSGSVLAADLAHALDPVLWAREVLQWEADAIQGRLLRSAGQRVMLCCTRQWGKSTTTATAAAHRALYRPGELIVVLSPSARQSAELIRKMETVFRRVGEEPKGDGDNAISVVLKNGSRVVGLPGKEGTIRGFSGPGLIIVDEASKVADSVYFATRPMLATRPDGAVWLLSTPFGRRGFFWKEWQDGNGWDRIKVTGPECSRIARSFLDEERRCQPDWWFRQEYLCEFCDVTDSAFSHQTILDAVSDEVEPLEGFEDE